MEITWNPLKQIAGKETIQITDSRNFKKDIMVILKSIDKNNKKKPTVAAINKVFKSQSLYVVPTKLNLKAQSPVANRIRKKSNELRLSVSSATKAVYRSNIKFSLDIKELKPEVLSPKTPLRPQNTTYSLSRANITLKTPHGKENLNPTTPTNASAMFDQFNFTPATDNRNKSINNSDYLASLPTPVMKSSTKENQTNRAIFNISEEELRHSSFQNIVQLNVSFTPPPLTQEMVTTETSILCNLATPSFSQNNTIEPPETCLRRKLFDQTYDLNVQLYSKQQQPSSTIIEKQTLTLSPNNCQARVFSPNHQNYQLAIIKEEHQSIANNESVNQKTFNISPEASLPSSSPTTTQEGISLVGTPLRKKFQSMKELNKTLNFREQQMLRINQGSMPNLREIDEMNPIENNRYYYQCIEKDEQENPMNTSTSSVISTISTKSTNEILFKEHEILAQSSQFNINEIEKRSNNHSITSSTANSNSYFFDINTTTVTKNKKEDIYFAVPKIRVSKLSSIKSNASSNSTLSLKPNTSSILRVASSTPNMPKRQRDETLAVSQHLICKFSPPKRSRTQDDLDVSDTLSTSSRSSISSSACGSTNSLRSAKSWATIQPKKIRIPKVPIQQLYLKRQREERVILYDSELHIQGE